jgi:hypothetical protein
MWLLTYNNNYANILISKLDQQVCTVQGVAMSAVKEMPLYAYNVAAGMKPAAAARDARAKFIILQAVWFKLSMLLVVMGSFAFVIANPMYEHASGLERMKVIAWATLVGMILATYFPIKARSITFWVAYVILLCPVVLLIVISS